MSTNVTYNAVTITDCLTRQFRQDPVYDPSGTDIEFQRFVVRVFGILHDETAAAAFGFGPLTGGDTIVSVETRLREKLMQSNKVFRMTVGGTTLLESHNTGGTLQDVDNGPKPRSLDITRVTGINAFHIEFEIEVCLVECANSSNTRGVLNNRWQVTDVVSEDFSTTRTITGRMRVKSGTNIHSLRGVVVPPLPNGFRRTSITITINEAATEMAYTVVDSMIPNSSGIPKGATRWKGTHTQSTGKFGVIGHAHFAVDVWGAPNADKKRLFQIASQIVGSRIVLSTLTDSRIIESVELIDFMDEQRVSLRLAITDTEAFQQTAIGNPVKLDAQIAPPSQLYGDPPSLATLLSARLQSPCNDDHEFRGDPVGSRDLVAKSAGGQASVTINQGEIPALAPPPAASRTHKANIYTHCKMSQRYYTRSVTAVLPVAAIGGGNQQQGQSIWGAGAGQRGGSVASFLANQPMNAQNVAQPTVSVATLAKPIHYREIHFEMERTGIPPELPQSGNFQEGPIAYILLETEGTPSAPQITPDGKKIYSVVGKYTYVASAPPPSSQAIDAGSLPWDTTNANANTIPSSSFVPGITT